MPYITDTSSQWIDVSSFPETNINYHISLDNPHIQVAPDVKIIAIQCEPNEISNLRELFILNHKRFHLLLTFDEQILQSCPNAKFVPYGTTWFGDGKSTYKIVDITRKQPKISTVVGLKEMTRAHTFRKSLYFNQLNIPLPITWFRSSRDGGGTLPSINNNPLLKDSKEDLFIEYQFSLVIENSRQKNYFSEKLIDCLLMKTIPIYYGCENISDFFDTSGWVLIQNRDINELKTQLPKYEDYINIINKNYEIALTYSYYPSNIRRALL